jgi:plastocyanin
MAAGGHHPVSSARPEVSAMTRVLASVLIALVVGLALTPNLSAPTPALAEGLGGWGMMGPRGLTSGATQRGCGGGQQSVAAGAIADLPSVTVSIHDGFFLPDQLSVPAGTRILWVNRGDRPHTTTAWNRWNSGVMMPGQSCEAWFVTPGSYDYLSIVAADGGTMRANVTVQGSLADVTGPGGSSGTMR